MPIIYRLKDEKDEKKFSYILKDGSRVVQSDMVDYLNKLVIPPAWSGVEIYYQHKLSPKILYMGYDAKGRQQVIYSPAWKAKTSKEKFCELIQFGMQLPKIQADIKSHLETSKWTKNKIVALVLRVISFCYFRVGNIKYENLYSSYGITTITKKHLTIRGDTVKISFIGKKGLVNECVVVDTLAVKSLKELASMDHNDEHLFMYQDGKEFFHVTAIEVNNYLKEYHDSFTSKMFRTFDTNTMLIHILRQNDIPETASKRKKEVLRALETVSTAVHNTPAICRKDYADMDILTMYIDHPKKFKSTFLGDTSERITFINFLKSKCPASPNDE